VFLAAQRQLVLSKPTQVGLVRWLAKADLGSKTSQRPCRNEQKQNQRDTLWQRRGFGMPPKRRSGSELAGDERTKQAFLTSDGSTLSLIVRDLKQWTRSSI